MRGSAAGVTRMAEKPEAPVRSDSKDVELAAKGDSQAFERLYHAEVGRIHSLARRMLSPEEADEATQDVFVRAWDKLGTFRGDAAFGTWLHRLAVNVFLALRKTAGKKRERMLEGDDLFSSMASRPAQSDLSMDFQVAIARLPDGAKKIFVLHDVEGFKHSEIAEMLGVSPGTSKAQLHRARMALRKYLER
jgi:RNA polymerase sigma-70 factor (ECF subfamily)